MEYKNLLKKNKDNNKEVYFIGDINLNSLDYETNNCVKNFFNLSFRNSFFPIITRPTRVTTKSATSIDHILTNAISYSVWYYTN